MTDPHHRPEEASAGGWSRLDTVLLVAIVLGAAVLRFASLGRPVELVFDEIFYARDACWYVIGTEDVCGITDLASRAHPPLGKWLIGAGIAALRLRPVRLARRGGGGRDGDRGPRLPAGLAPAAAGARRRSPPRSARRPRPGCWRSTSCTSSTRASGCSTRSSRFFVVGAVFGDRPRPGPSTRADRCAVVVAPHPRPPVAARGGHLPRRRGGREVVGGLRRAGGHRPRRRVGDRRAETCRAGRRMGGAGSAARSGARRCRRSSCWGRARSLVYVASYTGRMPGELVALPWVQGSVWRGIWEHQRAMLDFHTALVGRPPVPVAAVVVAADQAPGRLLVQRRGRRLPRDPGHGQPGRLVAGARGARRARRHLVAGRMGRRGGPSP